MASGANSAALIELIDEEAARYGGRREGLLPLLHALQAAAGYVDDSQVGHIAQALNLSRADVHGVLTFYKDFRRRPGGRRVIRYCQAESCQARGAAALEPLLEQRLGVAMGATRADGAVTLEPVFCLGLCAVGPNALVDGRPVGRLDAEAVERLAAEIVA